MAIRHTHPWLVTILTSVALIIVASCGQTPDADFEAEARAKIASFQSSLQEELRTALEAGGPANAVEVCSERAQAVAAAHSTGGLRVRRIGTRVRNRAANEPTAVERTILDEFAALPPDQRSSASHILEGDGHRAFYAPIWVSNPLCLGCHGEPEAMDTKVREILATRYPDDEATGYGLGDLRGAFVVETAPD